MKSILYTLILTLISYSLYAQPESVIVKEIVEFQQNLDEQYKNPETSILLPADLKAFDGLEFYPINLDFRIEARLVKTPNETPFQMPTTTERLPWYVKYGELHFTIYNTDFILDLFQNVNPKIGYEDYLFLPFTDLTSGDGSYGGGRYIDLMATENQTIILDFNQSYNPYCTYNPMYSCPIPPEQNDLKLRIESGIKDFKPTSSNKKQNK